MSGIRPELARGWVLDVDGCLMRTEKAGGSGGTAMPFAAEFLESLRADGSRIIVCTNASEKPPSTYLAHLQEAGLPIEADEFMTAGSAAAEYIARHHPGARIFALAGEGVGGPLRAKGCDVFDEPAEGELADVVVVGAARQFSTAAVNTACLSVDAGAPLYVTVEAPWFHGGVGRSVSISAAMAAAVGWVTDVKPIVLGKPSAALAQTLVETLGIAPDRISVVGDASAEIELARHMGARSILVLSGATSAEEASTLEPPRRPDLVLPDVASLHHLRLSH